MSETEVQKSVSRKSGLNYVLHIREFMPENLPERNVFQILTSVFFILKDTGRAIVA